MNRFLLAAALTVLGSAQARAEDTDIDAQVTEIEGRVELRRSGEKAFERIKKTPVELEAGDTVRTGADGRAEVGIDGGSVIEIQKNGEFTIGATDRKDSYISLAFGTLLAKLQSLRKGERFKVKTLTAVAAVRGTEFGVSADEAGSKVGVFDEGTVAVSDLAEKEEVLVQPNQETDVRLEGKPTPPEALKYFAFHKQRMVQMRKRLTAIRGGWKKRNLKQREGVQKKLDRLRKKKKSP